LSPNSQWHQNQQNLCSDVGRYEIVTERHDVDAVTAQYVPGRWHPTLEGCHDDCTDCPAGSKDYENNRRILEEAAGEQLPHEKAEAYLGAAHVRNEENARNVGSLLLLMTANQIFVRGTYLLICRIVV
jgi:hypothetical protein